MKLVNKNGGLIVDSVQAVTATGTITSWNSTVLIGTLTSDITLTLPLIDINDTNILGQQITFKRTGSDGFNVYIVAASGQTTEITTPTSLSTLNGSLTVKINSLTSSFQISNVGIAPVLFEGAVVPLTNNTTFNTTLTNIGTLSIPSAGTWAVSYSIYGSNLSVSEQTAALYNSSNVIVSNSFASTVAQVLNQGTTPSIISTTFYITTVSAEVFTLKAQTSVGTYTVKNSATQGGSGQGNSHISYQKVSGNLPVSGQLVDFINVNAGAAQTVTGNTTANTLTAAIKFATPSTQGNIPFDSTTGKFTLSAGKTYRLEATVPVLAGNTVLQWVNATTGQFIGRRFDQSTTAPINVGGVPVIITPSVTTDVYLQVVYAATIAAGFSDANGARFCSATITQLGSTASLTNSYLTISDLPTGGVITSGTVDPYILGYNVTQTTSGQSVSLPSPTTTTVNRIIYVNNTGTAAFQINGFTVSAGQSQAFIWNGTAWSNFSNNTNQNVISEYGENNSIVHGSTFTTTLADISGSNFTLPSAGTWEVYYSVHGRNSAVAISDISIYDSNNNLVPTSTSESTTYTAGYADGYQQSGKVIITTTAATSYKLRGITNGGTYTVQNLSQSTSAASGGNSKISWVKLGGFLPISGTAATTQTIYNNNYVPATVGNIGNTGGATFKVGFTGQYEFTCQGSGYTAASGSTKTGTFQVRQGTSVISTGTVNFYFNQASVHTVLPTNVFFANLTAGITYNIIWNPGTFTCDNNDYFLVTAKQVGASPINTFTGSTALTSGTTGYLPAPAAGTQDLFLKGDGTWSGAIANINNISNTLNITNATGDVVTSFIFPTKREYGSTGFGYAFIRGGRVFSMGTNGKIQNGTAYSNELHEISVNLYKADGNTPIGYMPLFSKLNYNDILIIAIDQNKKLWIAASNNSYGTYGDGTTTARAVNIFYNIEYFNTNSINIVDVQVSWGANGEYIYALSDVGDVYFWGYNLYGVGSTGTTTNVLTPTKITSWGTTLKCVKIFTGGYGAGLSGHQSNFILTDGSLWSCGYNAQSQLGDGTTTQVNTAKQIISTNVTDVACGGYSQLIVKADGSVWGTGGNTTGALGLANTTNVTVYTKSVFAGLAKEVYMNPHNTWSAIRTTTDEIYFMGANTWGQFGEGVATATANYTTPFKPTAPFQGTVKQFIMTGQTSGSTIGIVSGDNSIYTAGYNGYGQLGQGNTTATFLYNNTWHKVGSYSDWAYLWAGGGINTNTTAFVAVNTKGQLYNWGQGQNLAFGQNLNVNTYAPQYVRLDNSVAPVPANYTSSTVNYDGLTAGLVPLSANPTGVMVGSSVWTSTSGLNVDNTNNRVGIGTNSPKTKLSVINSGTSSVVPASGGGEIISDSVNARLYLEHNAAISGSRVIGLSDISGVFTIDSYNDTASTVTKQGIISANHLTGNVGIGTISPTSLLHINDTTSLATPSLEISGTNTTALGTLTATQLESAGLFIHQAAVGGVGSITSIIAGGKTTGNFPSDIRFLTTNAGGVQATERLIIRRDGNIGISTSVPLARLDITGVNNTGSTEIVRAMANNLTIGTSLTSNGLYATGTLANNNLQIGARGTGITAIGVTSGGSPQGNVGIGTTTPTSTFQINGSEANTLLSITAATTLANQKYIIAGGATTYLVTLPTASTCTGRVYHIKTTGIAKTISTFTTISNTTSTVLPLNTSILLVSDGTAWQQF